MLNSKVTIRHVHLHIVKSITDKPNAAIQLTNYTPNQSYLQLIHNSTKH